ncbi:polymorphic toxin type 43 domain-containing protein [Flavobacterium sp. N2270]|uniref:polymorphic toxin type 43 domain-containing protein n=1 Tax=Flavobacterium sp. N2270 TaxID=2986831 RepID=UPI0022249646|nr:polymorphic toxin type 43 domain-containing protein [Flavobacterium sp. N2270]
MVFCFLLKFIYLHHVLITYFATNDYPTFGMLVPNRHGSSSAYRYGFQGQEKDDELKGEGNSLNYTFRMHDPRVGRFFAVDPLTHKYPHYTPYSFSGNKVIHAIELEGLEEIELINAKDFRAKIFIVQPGDNLSIISKSTGVALNDIIKYNSFIEDPNKIYPGQILHLQGNLQGIKLNEFKVNKGLEPEGQGWWEQFFVELVSGDKAVQRQLEIVMLVEGGAALTSLPRLLKSGYKGAKKLLSPKTATPKAPLSGSGPTAGVLEVSKNVKSVAQFKNYNPKNAIEFVFDPSTERFVVGSVKSPTSGLSPHQNLAKLINGDKGVVGGMFKRGSNGEIITNEMSGHYHQNWTPEIRTKFKSFLESNTGQTINHIEGPTF